MAIDTFVGANQFQLAKHLEAEGLLPKNCRNVEIVVPTDGEMVIRYECLIAGDDLPKLSRAFAAMQYKKTWPD